MIIKTSDTRAIRPFIKQLHIPHPSSHKGDNGRLLIIGGSSLFHAASIWAAQIASHIVDIVHYASTKENNEIILSLKKKFHNGIVVTQKDIQTYAEEDDAILIGPGMVRGEHEEAKYTYRTVETLIKKFPDKRFVLDAGAIQMMKPEWLTTLTQKPLLTPHQLEFERLFGISLQKMTKEEKAAIVLKTARTYRAVILLKTVYDIVSDGEDVYIIEGGNAGLTKGGTGDTLAGLAASFFTKSDALTSGILASYIIKQTADDLYKTQGYWYNADDLIEKIPTILRKLHYN